MLTSEEIVRNEMLTKQETEEIITNQIYFNFDDSEVFELRELLTYVKCSSQLIESSHPDVKEFLHWSEMTSDLDLIADKLSSYERKIHNIKEASSNIQ